VIFFIVSGCQETFTVQKGILDTSGIAPTDTKDLTRDWIPDISLRIMDVILVGPQRRVVQVSDLVPLQGGLEIYGSDRHGNHVYIPANSSLPDHQYVLAAGQRQASNDDGKVHCPLGSSDNKTKVSSIMNDESVAIRILTYHCSSFSRVNFLLDRWE